MDDIRVIAEDVIKIFEKVSSLIKSQSVDNKLIDAKNLANINILTSANALKKVDKINSANSSSIRQLSEEPAVARIVCEDEDGIQIIYYVTRATPISGLNEENIKFASYNSPVGAVASLNVGSEFILPNGKSLEVLEKSMLKPTNKLTGWDSIDTFISSNKFNDITIESLRVILKGETDNQVDEIEDKLSGILAAENEKSNIFEGRKRYVIDSIGFRDQPILDEYQDQIFRMPINKKLIILGPPGTGKTTTLIKRLGQKLSDENLDGAEKNIIRNANIFNAEQHFDSWVMFTPTTLLKQYLKEAFARENIPASDVNIKTWDDYRRELAREMFSILRTANGGLFVINKQLNILSKQALDKPFSWFDEFHEWQKINFFSNLKKSIFLLHEHEDSNTKNIVNNLIKILDNENDVNPVAIFTELASKQDELRVIDNELKSSINKIINLFFNTQLNKDENFLYKFSEFLDNLTEQNINEDDEVDEELEEDMENQQPVMSSRQKLTNAKNILERALKNESRLFLNKRYLSKNSKNFKIIEWLNSRNLDNEKKNDLGTLLTKQLNIRKLINPLSKYLNRIPARYKFYRKEIKNNDSWYINDFKNDDITYLEIDIIILSILRSYNDFIERQDILNKIDNPIWSPLKKVLDLYKNQVLVDEATDFSTIQLACMSALSNPKINSIFLCGDLNQRLTDWGIKNTEELQLVFSNLEIKQLNFPYRQSKQLNNFSNHLIKNMDETVVKFETVGDELFESVSPSLLENATTLEKEIEWLAERIKEIENVVGKIPSTAIFVNSDDQVQIVGDLLGQALEKYNINVVPCPKGQAMGLDNDVRVFDIKHIKGLEFETVFFVSIDDLFIKNIELFDKYLYVGVTRAANYFGCTCKHGLPEKIEKLKPLFVPNWR